MKALSFAQPNAHLIVTPEIELAIKDRRKRVDWRDVKFDHQGTLVVHASASRHWLNREDDSFWYPSMAFKSLVGIVEVLAVYQADEFLARSVSRNHLWALSEPDPKSTGWVMVFGEAMRFRRPIPWRGKCGLFDVPDEVVVPHIEYQRTRGASGKVSEGYLQKRKMRGAKNSEKTC